MYSTCCMYYINREDLIVIQVFIKKITNMYALVVVVDIYLADDQGKKYNIEIQRVSKGARYHSSLIDATSFTFRDKYKDFSCSNF